ncbi:uncharacterized protein LOC129607044 [Condylostylus longicornis]|uniref:uncharacterized protein LOC129607044 n=1 Tax=Condylostylus longicornis TaxID=2530218 RepID=UPI00244DAB24|nr:uncharacterized protein LOC129607044 [Condylostylus longicornis]
MELDSNDFIDILIIGGGLSGLTSAYKIKEKDKNLNVVILEATSRLGGQIIENFISSNLVFDYSKKILRILVRIVCGNESKNIKLTEFLSICNSAGGIQNILDLHIKSGLSIKALIGFSSEKLIEKFKYLLNNTQILTNVKVTDIYHYPDYVLVKDSDGKIFNTSVLILAIPWNHLKDINIFPSIPKELSTTNSHLKYFITFYLIEHNDIELLQKDNLCGSFLSLEKPILIFRECKMNKLVAIITYEQNLLLNLPPTTPWNRIIFSSTTAATAYRGCVSGAIQSGYRAAINALLIIRPQNVSWKDLDQIQKARPLKRYAGRFKKLLSKINLFNCGLMAFSILK